MAKIKKYTFVFPVVSIFLLFAIFINSAIAIFKSTPLQLQGVWEFDEYYAFDPETNRYGRQKRGGMGGLPYIAFSGEYVCPWGTIVGETADPCENGFLPYTIEKDLITIERKNKSPLIWRFAFKNKKLEINELSVEPVWGTQEHKQKFIYKKSDAEINLSNFLPPEEELLLAPTKISNVKISDITAHGATITWTTDQPATSDIDYRTSASGSAMAGSQELVTEHSVTLGNLDGGKRYPFFIQACNNDVQCITNKSDNLSFTTLEKSAQLQKIECEGATMKVPSDRWLVYIRHTPESVIAELIESGVSDEAFEIALREFARGEIDFSYRIFSPNGKEIKTGPMLEFSLRPGISTPSWVALVDPYYISDISAKTNRGGFYDYNILWKGEKLPDSTVEFSCNGEPFNGIGKVLTDYEWNQLPWKKRLQGAWQLKEEGRAERMRSGDFLIYPHKETDATEYIIFKNNKVCINEYPCPKEKFFPFSISKQVQRNRVTPSEVTLVIKTPLRRLRWGLSSVKKISWSGSPMDDPLVIINKDEYTSQIFESIEEALLELQSPQAIPESSPAELSLPESAPTPSIPPPPSFLPPPPPPPPSAPAPTSLP